MDCPVCHSTGNPEGAHFCSQCGRPLAPAPAAAASPGRIGSAAYRISGFESQAAVVSLQAGQGVLAEPGALLYMHGDIEMQTGTGGGLFAGFKRALAGDSFFLSSFSSASAGEVCFAAPYPGTIYPLAIGATDWLCQRHSFLCCSPEVQVSIALTQKLGYGLFGGEGFILQRLTGQGDALVHAGGHFIEKTLAPGEQMRIDTGTVVAFDAGMSYNIQFVKGFKNLLFGGEGLFFVALTGPGRVILQTLSFDRLASRIVAAAGVQSQGGGGAGLGTALGAGAVGSILGGLLGGDN